jgi:hypothetical protein
LWAVSSGHKYYDDFAAISSHRNSTAPKVPQPSTVGGVENTQSSSRSQHSAEEGAGESGSFFLFSSQKGPESFF